ncbi:MarR family transcriptional regulator [Corynebacterium argentoratense]|nr:MarR family transcriptional regulator [Corynebacterium argentoratense]
MSVMTNTPLDIASQIRPAMTKLYVTYFRVAQQSDLTGPQLTIMTRLEEHGPARISEVAREEGIRIPTASNALHQLEERGMISRLRDTSDKRGVRVKLTAQGREELKRVGAERDRHFATLLELLDEDELKLAEQLIPVIKRLASNYNPEAFEK